MLRPLSPGLPGSYHLPRLADAEAPSRPKGALVQPPTSPGPVPSRTGRSRASLRRRLEVAFLNAASFTSNVGRGGFATERIRVLRAGLQVEGIISFAEREFPFAGRVAWSLPGDPVLSLRGRMGVQFIHIDPAFRGLMGPPEPTRPGAAPPSAWGSSGTPPHPRSREPRPPPGP